MLAHCEFSRHAPTLPCLIHELCLVFAQCLVQSKYAAALLQSEGRDRTLEILPFLFPLVPSLEQPWWQVLPFIRAGALELPLPGLLLSLSKGLWLLKPCRGGV